MLALTYTRLITCWLSLASCYETIEFDSRSLSLRHTHSKRMSSNSFIMSRNKCCTLNCRRSLQRQDHDEGCNFIHGREFQQRSAYLHYYKKDSHAHLPSSQSLSCVAVERLSIAIRCVLFFAKNGSFETSSS